MRNESDLRAEPSWRRELSEAITNPRELIDALGLNGALLEAAEAASAKFPLRVTRGFLNRMRRGDPTDPLLRQVLPLADELETVAGYSDDPLREAGATRASNLLQKYRGRALLITTAACAIHCRYCFRREFDYGPSRWDEALATIARDSGIEEVILSGGDPGTAFGVSGPAAGTGSARGRGEGARLVLRRPRPMGGPPLSHTGVVSPAASQLAP